MKLEAFFRPRSIAVIGASRDEEKVGHRIFKNLVDSRFQGELYPINPNAERILGFKCYKSVLDVPSEIDLSIIAVPAKIVPLIAKQCGEKGVKGIT
ncbi:CoA-binding protein, partial [Candidatus Bathyarchaeota archaeon]